MDAIWPLPPRALIALVWALLVVSVCALGLAPAALAQTPAPPTAAVAAPHARRRRGVAQAPRPVPGDLLGMNGRTMLLGACWSASLGLVFGLVIYAQLKKLPVHKSMREISELIYETCKTYLITQGKFILILEVFIGVDHRRLLRRACSTSSAVQGRHHPALQPGRHRRQLRRGLVRHPRQHLRQLAHRLRQPARQALPDATRSRSRPA